MSGKLRSLGEALRRKYAATQDVPLESVGLVQYVRPDDTEDIAVGSADGPVWNVMAGEVPSHIKRALRGAG